MKLEVIVTNPAIDWMESILCSGAGSCKDVQMTVTKDVPRWATNRQLLIGELECESPESCRNGMFDLGVGVQFARCTCGRKAGHFYIISTSVNFFSLALTHPHRPAWRRLGRSLGPLFISFLHSYHSIPRHERHPAMALGHLECMVYRSSVPLWLSFVI